MWPVYEFRLLPGALKGPVRRYAEGKWLEDDGETYDLAFISGWGAPICKMIDPPYQRNIVWGWCTGGWRSLESRHPRANPWHYALRDGTTEWGGDWGRDQHPNHKAGRAGMQALVSEHRCANGDGIDVTRPGRHLLAGLLRERDTGIVLAPPPRPTCMYCGDVWEAP